MDWRALLFAEERETEPVKFWGRAALYGVLFVWGWRFILSSVAQNYVGESFLHWVNLPFHEAGHVIFGSSGTSCALEGLNLLAWDRTLGVLSYDFGRLLMLTALAWGGWLLACQWRELKASRQG